MAPPSFLMAPERRQRLEAVLEKELEKDKNKARAPRIRARARVWSSAQRMLTYADGC
jgi:hypothetical protein